MQRPAVHLRRSLQAATLALALLLLALAWITGRPSSHEHDRPHEASASPAPATVGRLSRDGQAMPEAPGAAGRYRPGDLLRYAFDCRQVVTTDVAQLAGDKAAAAPEPIRIVSALRGSITIKVYAEDADGWTLGCELAGLEAAVEANGAAATDPRVLVASLTTEVLTFCEKNGKLRGLWFAAAVPAEARNILRALVARLHVVLPEDAAQQEWQAVEADPTGRCLVTYRRVGQGGAEIAKRKERYLETFHGGGLDATSALTVEGETLILLRDEVPASIAGKELVRVEGSAFAGSLRLEDEHRFALEWRRSSPRLAEEGRSIARRGAPSWSSFAPETAGSREDSGAAAAGLEETLARIEELFGKGEASTPETVELLQRLAELVAADDAAPAKLLQLLARRQEDVALWQSLAGILGAAGTEAAQRSLIAVMTEEDWPEAWRVTALAALAQAERPLAALDDLLTSLHEEGGDLAPNALLVLGAAGARVRDGDAERHGRIQEYVVEAAVRAGTDPAKVVIALEALGNLGPAATPAPVLQAYHDGEEIVRASAVRALRRTDDAAAERLLATALATDPSEDVRIEAVSALAARDSGARALQDALVRDPSERVRRRVARELAASSDGRPAGDLLRWAANNDPAESVRDRAARSLGDAVARPPAAQGR